MRKGRLKILRKGLCEIPTYITGFDDLYGPQEELKDLQRRFEGLEGVVQEREHGDRERNREERHDESL